MWYITNHHPTINTVALQFKDVLPIPKEFENFDGYNDYKRKRVKVDQLSLDVLEGHSQALYSLLLKPICNSTTCWVSGSQNIKQLADCLQSYVDCMRKESSERKSVTAKQQLLEQ